MLGLTNYAVLLQVREIKMFRQAPFAPPVANVAWPILCPRVAWQEFLRGDEYVVDTVSRSGVHKCVAIWKYDKRRYNKSPVVYFGMRLMPVEAEPELKTMVEYIFGVLEALGIRNGAIHSEVKFEDRGPVLIETNCRLHGGEGTWAPMAEACLGYSAISAMLDAYLDPAAFGALPKMPTNFRAHAKEAKLRSPVSGIVKAIDPNALKAIRALPSFASEMIAVAPGKPIEMTIDAVTACGNVSVQKLLRDAQMHPTTLRTLRCERACCLRTHVKGASRHACVLPLTLLKRSGVSRLVSQVNLVNEDLAQLENDYARLHEIVDGGGKGIFIVEGAAA